MGWNGFVQETRDQVVSDYVNIQLWNANDLIGMVLVYKPEMPVTDLGKPYRLF